MPKNENRPGNTDQSTPLDAIFAALEQEVKKNPQADDGLALLEAVAESDGLAVVDELLAAGFRAEVIAAAVQPGTDDKRIRPRLRAGLIAGTRAVWLTSAGWASCGVSNRRESSPSASTLRHRLAPTNCAARLAEAVEPTARERGVLLSTVSGKDLRDYCEQRRGDAWSVIKTEGREAANEASAVLGGVLPDLLLAESWHESVLRHRLTAWPTTSDPVAAVDPMPADWLVAVEVELSGKSSPMTTMKVRRHTTAMKLGWWQSVLWVVDGGDDTVERLRRAGATNERENPGHYFVQAAELGIGGTTATMPDGARLPWWNPLVAG